MLGTLRKIWADQDTIEKKFFWMVIVMEVVVTFVSGIFTYFEELSVWAYLSCFVTSFLVAGFGLLAYKTREYGLCYMGAFYVIGLVLMPAAFFFCGGVKSGMPMYCSTLMLVGAVAPVRAKHKWIAFAIVLLWMGAAMIFSLSGSEYSKMLLTEVSERASAIDVVASYIIMSVVIYCIGVFVVAAYAKEREQRERLVSRLDYLSKRDPLTELYNRRYLIQYLENMTWNRSGNFYIIMFDLDDFKQVNDTYGHIFGDQVLRRVSRLFDDFVNDEVGECAVRYGGEEFICIIKAKSEVDAFARADKFREAVAMLQWPDNPMLHLTISGGFMACKTSDESDHKLILRQVDELLFTAKSRGKNQIRNHTI